MQSILKQFTQREAGPLIQFVKYAIGGAVATVVHAASFYLLAWLVLPALQPTDIVVLLTHISVPDLPDVIRARNAMIDNGTAFIVSNLTAYIINIRWVFEPGRHHRVIEIGMFYLVSGISLAAGSALMGILISYFSISTTVAFVAVVITSVLINFVLRKYVIFKR